MSFDAFVAKRGVNCITRGERRRGNMGPRSPAHDCSKTGFVSGCVELGFSSPPPVWGSENKSGVQCRFFVFRVPLAGLALVFAGVQCVCIVALFSAHSNV